MVFAIELVFTGGALVSGARVDERGFPAFLTVWAVAVLAVVAGGAFMGVVAERLAGSDSDTADAAVAAALL
jgi:hypothetical protein